jgi:hypothetical protein
MAKESINDEIYTVKCNDCDFEKQVGNATYALNTLQLHKNETGHFNNYIKTECPLMGFRYRCYFPLCLLDIYWYPNTPRRK